MHSFIIQFDILLLTNLPFPAKITRSAASSAANLIADLEKTLGRRTVRGKGTGGSGVESLMVMKGSSTNAGGWSDVNAESV